MMPMEPRLDFSILADRIQRLLRLDTSVFDEVKQDPSATLPAVFVLAASTFLSGVGGWLWWVFQDFEDISGVKDGIEVFFQSAIVGSFFSIALWLVWLGVAWVILTQYFREDAHWQEMMRTMGLAAAPLSISVLMFIPGLDFGIALASVALFFGLTTIAIQSVTRAEPARVLVANLVGFGVWAVLLGVFATSESLLAPGIFLTDSASEVLNRLY